MPNLSMFEPVIEKNTPVFFVIHREFEKLFLQICNWLKQQDDLLNARFAILLDTVPPHWMCGEDLHEMDVLLKASLPDSTAPGASTSDTMDALNKALSRKTFLQSDVGFFTPKVFFLGDFEFADEDIIPLGRNPWFEAAEKYMICSDAAANAFYKLTNGWPAFHFENLPDCLPSGAVEPMRQELYAAPDNLRSRQGIAITAEPYPNCYNDDGTWGDLPESAPIYAPPEIMGIENSQNSIWDCQENPWDTWS